MSELIDREWRSFAERVLDPTSPPEHHTDLRRCFFAGARALLTLIMEEASGGDDVTDADMALMDGIEAELAQFARDVERGRA